MEALARLPVFFALAGKRAVVAGGNAGGGLEGRAAGGGRRAGRGLRDRPVRGDARAPPTPAERRRCIAARSTAEDFAGAAIAVGAFEDEARGRAFRRAARAAGVPVNVIDKPAFCDFSFGAIVNRSPLVIGISTDGAAPVFGQAIRAKIEALIPRGFARWAEAARRWRDAVQVAPACRSAGGAASGSCSPAHAVAQSGPRAGRRQTSTRCSTRRAARATRSITARSRWSAPGPGDPELLTLRAVRALQSADVILFDDLVSPGVLDFARREAKQMLVGKTGHGPACRQDEINALMITLARAGKRVVRLKGGDPMIFGRAGEEIAACRAAGIAGRGGARHHRGAGRGEPARRFADAPLGGAPAAISSPATARDGKLPRDIDWSSTRRPDRHHGGLHAGAHAGRAGRDAASPTASIRRRRRSRSSKATRPGEAVVAAPIRDLPARLAELPPGPVLVMIGRVFADIEAVCRAKARTRRHRVAACPWMHESTPSHVACRVGTACRGPFCRRGTRGAVAHPTKLTPPSSRPARGRRGGTSSPRRGRTPRRRCWRGSCRPRRG